jgi:hypothetical protein
VIVTPGHPRPYDESEWRDALVVVARGQIELESVRGERRRFGRGDVLWLQALPLRAISSHGDRPAVLVAFSRRAARPDGCPKG